MGAENSITGKVMAVTDDGREFVFENAIISSITVEESNHEYSTFDEKECTVTTNSFEIALEIKGVTRKRFVKLLMSKGIQRNGANELAKYSLKKYGNYSPLILTIL